MFPNKQDVASKTVSSGCGDAGQDQSYIHKSDFIMRPKLEDASKCLKLYYGGFPGGPVVKNPTASAGDVGSIPGWETCIPIGRRGTKPEHYN